MERIKALKDTPDIKIITGIRRSGKSNLMQVYIDYLEKEFDDTNIIFIDYMDLADAYPKMIIARTKHPRYTYEGIEVYDIAEWLLNER